MRFLVEEWGILGLGTVITDVLALTTLQRLIPGDHLARVFGILDSLLVGANLPFFGAVTANIMAWVKDMGGNGLVGLITLGLILWLFSNRNVG